MRIAGTELNAIFLQSWRTSSGVQSPYRKVQRCRVATQIKYGKSNQPAAGTAVRNSIVVARMVNHKMTISPKASPGDLSRKNSPDHATLSNSCSKKNCIGAAVIPTFRQTNQAAIAIARNRIVQTGPNSQLGGFHLGLLNPSYHGRRAGVVSNDPIHAAPRQTTMQTISRISNRYTSVFSKGALSINLG
jgi:hypothetical protein